MTAERIGADDGVIRLRVLGKSEIAIGRKRITPSAEVVFALGFYLCMRAGERLPRDEVAELFWGDGRETKGRHSLRQMLYRLRQKGFTLDEEGDELLLEPARVESDLAAALREDWPTRASGPEVEAAGQLAPGFSPTLTSLFGDWLDGVRARLAAQHRRGALHQASVARREGRWADLEKWALQVLMSDPLNEEATLARAESAAMAGSKAMALEIIDQYLEDLGDRSVQIGLPATLLRRRIAERRPDWSHRGPREVPLVGRAEVMRRLTDAVQRASSGLGSALLLWGAPGVGKSRLAEETRAFSELAGFRSIHLRSEDANADRPLSLVSALVGILRDLPGAAGCEPDCLALLASTIERSADDQAPLSQLRDSRSTRRALEEATRELISAVLTESRVAVVLEDLHNADTLSLAVIARIVSDCSRQRVLWVMTSRTLPHSASDGETGLRRSVQPIRIDPLDIDAATELATRLEGASGFSRSRVDCHAIARASGGNPLFVRELTWHTRAFPERDEIPSSLQSLMDVRLSTLGADAVRLLRLITLLGNDATVGRVSAVYGFGLAETTSQIERLEHEGILHLDASRALSLHDCWRRAVRDGLLGATRAALSLTCADALAREDTGPEGMWRAAELYVTSGEPARARALLVRCGDRLLALGFTEDAARTFTRALHLADNARDRVADCVRIARAHFASGTQDDVLAVATEGLATAREAGLHPSSESALLLSFRMEALTKLQRDHREDLDELARLASDERLPADVRQYLCYVGIRIVFQGSTSPLEDYFVAQSRSLESATGPSEVGALTRLIYAAERGLRNDVLTADRELDKYDLPTSPPSWRCRLLRTRAMALRHVGEVNIARRLLSDAYMLAASKKLSDEASGAAEGMTFLSLDYELLEDAETWLEHWASSQSAAYLLRRRSFAHAESRLRLQQGRAAEALSVARGAEQLTREDLLEKRRMGDFATIALAAIQTGEPSSGIDALEEVIRSLEGNSGSLQTDYPAEMAIRCLTSLGQLDRADALARTYLSKRLRATGTPFAPFASELRLRASSTTA